MTQSLTTLCGLVNIKSCILYVDILYVQISKTSTMQNAGIAFSFKALPVDVKATIIVIINFFRISVVI